MPLAERSSNEDAGRQYRRRQMIFQLRMLTKMAIREAKDGHFGQTTIRMGQLRSLLVAFA